MKSNIEINKPIKMIQGNNEQGMSIIHHCRGVMLLLQQKEELHDQVIHINVWREAYVIGID